MQMFLMTNAPSQYACQTAFAFVCVAHQCAWKWSLSTVHSFVLSLLAMSALTLPSTHGFTVVPLMTHIWVSPLRPPAEKGVDFQDIKLQDAQLAP